MNIEERLAAIEAKLDLLFIQKLESDGIVISWKEDRLSCEVRSFVDRYWFTYSTTTHPCLHFGDGFKTRKPEEILAIMATCLKWINVNGKPHNIKYERADSVIVQWAADLEIEKETE